VNQQHKRIVHAALGLLPHHHRQHGQIFLLFALSIGVLMGFAALAVDVGMALQVKRQYQKVAEVCAVVGAQQFGIPSGVPQSSAQTCVANNLAGITGTANVPPQGGAHSCANDAANCNRFLEVIISQPTPTFFARILAINQLAAYGRAVAGGFQPVDFGMIGLRRDAHSTVSNGGSGAAVRGSACTAGVFDVNGNLSITGLGVANQGFDGQPTSSGGNLVPGPPCLDPQYPLPIQSSLPPYVIPPVGGGVVQVLPAGAGGDFDCPVLGATTSIPPDAVKGRLVIDCNDNNINGTIQISGPRSLIQISAHIQARLTVELMNTAVVQNLCAESPSINAQSLSVPNLTCSFQGNDHQLKLAPGYYDVIKLNAVTNTFMKPGLYMISTGLNLGGGNSSLTSGTAAGAGVSIIVGITFDVESNNVVSLTCCAPEMLNYVLIYHLGGCDTPFAPDVSGTTAVSPFPRWPNPWNCTNPTVGTWGWPNQVNLQGNNTTRSFTGPNGGQAGSIYSPYLCRDGVSESCKNDSYLPPSTPGTPTPVPSQVSCADPTTKYPIPRFPCNIPQFPCKNGECVLVGGSGGTTIKGQLIGPNLSFNGNGIDLTYSPLNQTSGFRPYLAE
jgi:hypothetical protein